MKRITSLLVCFAMFGLSVLAQDVQITGKVTSADDGSILPGVSVVVKGTTIGTTSNINGEYSISTTLDATLVFSFIGMKSQEIEIGGQTSIDVAMEMDVTGLEEVVVTALGQTKAQKSLGYSVQSVATEEISRANNSDMINSINGRTAGVQITSSSGTPGASTFMTIRGAASITGNNQPLFVIDGMPIVTGRGTSATTNRDPYSTGGTGSSSRSIDINPEDIASMTVLKGGAATALYGLRAANGAIIITTKKGQDSGNKLNIDFHTSVGFDVVSQLPEMQQKFVQGSGGNWIGGNSGSWGPNVDSMRYDNVSDPEYKWDPKGQLVGQSDPNAGAAAELYDPYEFFQTGVTYNNRLSISSGNDKLTYFLSLGNLSQTGIVPNSSYNRTNIRLNASAKISKKVKLSTNMTYSNSAANQIQQGSNTSGVMLGLLRTARSFDNSAGYKFPDGTQRNYRNGGGYDNPYWTANENWLDDRTNRFIGNVMLNINFTDWFNLSYNVGTDSYTRRTKDVVAIYSRTYPAGAVEEGTYVSNQFNSDLLLNFQKQFGDLDTRLTLGNNLFQTHWEDLGGDAQGLEIPNFYQLSNSSTNNTWFGQNKYRTAALFADVQLGYKDMLFLGITGRTDWSTTMPEENLSAFYPSVNMGWVFTELSALKGNNILSFGKLRGSWATTANIATPYNTSNYYYPANPLDGWTNGVTFPYQGTTGFDVNYSLGNPDLKHETMVTTEYGVDLKFLMNRIGLDFTYFNNQNTDLLLSVPIAPSSGYGSVYMNAAEMESKGIELSLNAGIIQSSDFKWDLILNYTKMTNTVLSLAEGVESIGLGGFTIPETRAVAGRQYGSIYGNDWYRDPATGAVLINDDPTDAYRDGYPMTDTRQMVPVGDVNPDWTMNFTNSFSYKGVYLSAMIDIKSGGWMYNGTAFAMNFFGTHARTANREVYYTADGTIDFEQTPKENLQVFDGVYGSVDADGNPVSSGVDNVTPVVLDEAWFKGFGSNFGGGAQTASMEPADWVRLREITIGYTIPVQKKVLQSAEVYFTGRNLWLNTPYTGIDPETNLQGAINGQGMDYFNMPGTKTYTIGLKVSF